MKYEEARLFWYGSGYYFGVEPEERGGAKSLVFDLGPVPEGITDHSHYLGLCGAKSLRLITQAAFKGDIDVLKTMSSEFRKLVLLRQQADVFADEANKLRRERDDLERSVRVIKEHKKALEEKRIKLLLLNAPACPYMACNGGPSDIDISSKGEGEYLVCFIFCKSCGTSGPYAGGEEEAIGKWGKVGCTREDEVLLGKDRK